MKNLISIFFFIGFFVVGCGPSAEEQSTQTSIAFTETASSWTRTPTATQTSTATLTVTPTITPTPPNLPVEFFKQIPGGGYEVRDNGVFAPNATGSMRMWYEKQPDGSFREIYFRYGEPLTEQKKIELANKLVCEKAVTCISEGLDPEMKLDYFEFISTGIAEKQMVIDPDTGKYRGYLWDMVVVSRDVNQKPVIVREVLEVENFNNPGINISWMFLARSYFSENSDLDPIVNGHKLLGVDVLRDRYLPEGRMRTFIHIGGMTELRPNIGVGVREMLGNFGDASHFESAIKFIASRGVEVDPEVFLIWQGDGDRIIKQ